MGGKERETNKKVIRGGCIRFLQIAKANGVECHPHFVCAIDPKNFLRVFNDVKHIILRMNLEKLGLVEKKDA